MAGEEEAAFAVNAIDSKQRREPHRLVTPCVGKLEIERQESWRKGRGVVVMA